MLAILPYGFRKDSAMNTPNGAYQSLVDFMNKSRGTYSDWYAGIAENPKDRLTSGHGVTTEDYLFDFVPTSDEARQVEQALFKIGCDGGPGGGGRTTNGIYIYRKSRNTRE
jgi:hypothetical protein